MKIHNQSARHRGQRGVGLIEVLIAVLVLSIGLLGLAGLQVRTMRNNQSALERGVAVVETHAIADALRADRPRAILGNYNRTMTAPAPTGSLFREVVVAEWLANIRQALGNDANGEITCTEASCVIVIQWNDQRGTGGLAAQELRTEIQI
jgi:type IV pilus assembly protein PilV